MYRAAIRAYRRRHPTGALPSRLGVYPKMIHQTELLRPPYLLPLTSLLAVAAKSADIGISAGLMLALVILIFGMGRKPGRLAI